MIYSNMPQIVINEITAVTGIPETKNLNEAGIFILTYKNEMPELVAPETTIIIIEMDNELALSYAEQAIEKGVKDENILLVQKEQTVSIKELGNKIMEIKNSIEVSGFYLRSFDSSINPGNGYLIPNANVKKSKQIGVFSYKGGVGKTAIATALSFYFSSCGETVGLIDLGKPAASIYYLGKPPMANKEDHFFAKTMRGDIIIPKRNKTPGDITSLINEMSQHYDRLIFDFSAADDINFLDPSAIKLLIVDYDLRTLELTATNLKAPIDSYILIANRIPHIFSGTYSVVIADILKKQPDIEILADSDGCQAVLESYTPINDDRGSEIAAKKIGELASIINSKEEHYV